MAIEWYVRVGNTERGPISSELLKQLATKGKLGPEVLIRKGASGTWVPANRIKGLFPAPADQSPAAPAATPTASPAQPRPAPAPAAAKPVAASAPSGSAIPAPAAPATPRPRPATPKAAPAPTPPVPEALPAEETRPCPSCGKPNAPAATTCEHCQASFAPSPKAQRRVKSVEHKEGWLSNFWVRMALLALALFTVFGIFIGVVVMASKTARPSDPLIGKWEASETQDRVEFSTDGRVMFSKGGGEAYLKWSRLADGRLKVEGRSTGVVSGEIYEAVIEGDSMTLKKPHGEDETYRRVTGWKK